jgi:uncharacterized protein with von Willebrand factor type A (vWA) domain
VSEPDGRGHGAPGPGAAPALVVGLAHGLRARGMRVGIAEVLTATRALERIDLADGDEIHHALQAILCHHRDDLETFEEVYRRWSFGGDPLEDLIEAEEGGDEVTISSSLPREALQGDGEEDDEGEPDSLGAYSADEILRHKDFADYDDRDREAALALMRRLVLPVPVRPSRRLHGGRRRGRVVDVSSTLRHAMRHGGEPISPRFRVPRTRARPLVLVCDVSGSMSRYSRMLLLYVQICVSVSQRVEAFAFGTRLTRLTRELRGTDPARAVDRAARTVEDWSGGTRIGEAISELNRRHGSRLRGGSIVVILSDGWDRGDPALLAEEMARLRRTARRVIWLNPLKAQPGYQPLTRGMQAALPFSDAFLPAESIHSLEQLGDVLAESLLTTPGAVR